MQRAAAEEKKQLAASSAVAESQEGGRRLKQTDAGSIWTDVRVSNDEVDPASQALPGGQEFCEESRSLAQVVSNEKSDETEKRVERGPETEHRAMQQDLVSLMAEGQAIQPKARRNEKVSQIVRMFLCHFAYTARVNGVKGSNTVHLASQWMIESEKHEKTSGAESSKRTRAGHKKSSRLC